MVYRCSVSDLIFYPGIEKITLTMPFRHRDEHTDLEVCVVAIVLHFMSLRNRVAWREFGVKNLECTLSLRQLGSLTETM